MALDSMCLDHLLADTCLRAGDSRSCLVSLVQGSYHATCISTGAQGTLTHQIIALNTTTGCSFILLTVHTHLPRVAPLHRTQISIIPAHSDTARRRTFVSCISYCCVRRWNIYYFIAFGSLGYYRAATGTSYFNRFLLFFNIVYITIGRVQVGGEDFGHRLLLFLRLRGSRFLIFFFIGQLFIVIKLVVFVVIQIGCLS